MRHKASVIRKERFNAAHRLHNASWSTEKNKDVFGKCNNDNYHGHNYTLEVIVTGDIDPETGYVLDTKVLSDLVRKEIIDYLDHRNLNLDIIEFKSLNPTAENIAYVIYEILRPLIDSKLDLKLVLHETQNNVVIYPA